MPEVTRPTKQELLDARHKTVPDLIAPNLKVLFVGINPGLYTAAIGHHFGRPWNRFWPALFAGGFTPRLLKPFEVCLWCPQGRQEVHFVDGTHQRPPRHVTGGGRKWQGRVSGFS